jgi:hypothetical protein
MINKSIYANKSEANFVHHQIFVSLYVTTLFRAFQFLKKRFVNLIIFFNKILGSKQEGNTEKENAMQLGNRLLDRYLKTAFLPPRYLLPADVKTHILQSCNLLFETSKPFFLLEEIRDCMSSGFEENSRIIL